ncbi:hypothetical protein [Endozoicomonas sp. ALB091]|uniref:hypothetical protein n=1 Tax=Endozoicomonas sp. ALB091 TaxID=3403073 RepID=UPI003BB57A51
MPDTSFQVGSPFAAVMSSASKKKDDDLLILSELPWGEQRIMAVTAPQSIAFKCDSDIDIYFEYSNGKGWISSKDTWSLEKAEGAVVLTFCHVSERLSDDRDTVIQQSESVATIVFLPG